MFNNIKKNFRHRSYWNEIKKEVDAYTFKVEIKQTDAGFTPYVNNRPVYKYVRQSRYLFGGTFTSYDKGPKNEIGSPCKTQAKAMNIAEEWITDFKNTRKNKLYREKVNAEIMEETGGSVTYTA